MAPCTAPALCVAWVLLTSAARPACAAVAVVLGGFAAARVVGYVIDGVDADAALRFHQNAVFASEVLGATVALLLMPSASSAAAAAAAKDKSA